MKNIKQVKRTKQIKKLTTTWTNKYPSQKILRKEIQAEVDAVLEVLFQTFGKKSIKGIYFKGSASKDWDSIIDYVPEFSDVDIHVLFYDGALMNKKIGTVFTALNFGKTIETAFLRRIKKPLYLPRLQLLSLNDISKKDVYIPSPKSIVHKIYGVDYLSRSVSSEENISHALSGILEHETFVDKLAYKVMDSNHTALPKDLRDLFWRISSLGNNTLVLLGLSFDEAWARNRTGVVSKLRELDKNDIAEQYVSFYNYCWEYVLTRNPDYVRQAIIVGSDMINTCILMAKRYPILKKNKF